MEPHLKGMIPRLVEQVFASILAGESNVEYTVKVSYMEIYMERIKDLLAREFYYLAISLTTQQHTMTTSRFMKIKLEAFTSKT
jgi:hypothetical protein